MNWTNFTDSQVISTAVMCSDKRNKNLLESGTFWSRAAGRARWSDYSLALASLGGVLWHEESRDSWHVTGEVLESHQTVTVQGGETVGTVSRWRALHPQRQRRLTGISRLSRTCIVNHHVLLWTISIPRKDFFLLLGRVSCKTKLLITLCVFLYNTQVIPNISSWHVCICWKAVLVA